MADEYFKVLAYDHRVMAGFYDHPTTTHNDFYASSEYWRNAYARNDDKPTIGDDIPDYALDDLTDDEIII